MARFGSITSATDLAAGGGGVSSLFDTRAAVESATVPASTKMLMTGGFSAVGDGGHGLYKRRATTPYPLWVTGTAYQPANYLVQNSSGLFYRRTYYPGGHSGGFLSSNMPNHTTLWQYQAYADGYGWTREPQNPLFVRSVDRLRADGTVDALHGGWWELVPEGDAIQIEQVGGKADLAGAVTSTTATDNWFALHFAVSWTAFRIASNPLENFAYRIKYGLGNYWHSKTFYVYSHVQIEGMGNFQSLQTFLYFPPTGHGLVFHQGNTGPGGDWQGANGSVIGGGYSTQSRVKGLILYFSTWELGSGGAMNLSLRGIYARCTIHLEDVSIMEAPGDGVFYKAYAGHGGDLEGNANQWSVINLYVQGCKGDAFRVEGADVNGGYMSGFRTHPDVRGCGIRNQSYFTNCYTGLQITGYGNMGVWYAGKRYSYIHDQAYLVTPGTDNRKWYFMGDWPEATGQWPVWNNADPDQMRMKCPIYDSGSGSIYLHPYVEGGGACISHVIPPSHVFGGISACTTYSNFTYSYAGEGPTSLLSAGSRLQFLPGSPEYAANGSETYAMVGGGDQYTAGTYFPGGIQILRHFRQIDGDSDQAQWGYRDPAAFNGAAIIYSYFNATPFWEQTTRSSYKVYGRSSVPQAYRIAFYDPILQSPINGFDGRAIGMRGANPITENPGYGNGWARGERYWNINANGTTEPGGWVCTTSGTKAYQAWSAGMSLTAGTYTTVSTTSGRRYKIQAPYSANAHANEPSHTSGIVTGADGHRWAYAGDGDPVFMPFLDIPATKPTITGSRGGNAALASLITQLAGLGIIVDGTSA